MVCLLGWSTVSTPVAAEQAQPEVVGIVADGKSDWRIVCPPPASPGVNWAARELQKYVLQISGCKLTIVQRTRGKPALAVGLRR